MKMSTLKLGLTYSRYVLRNYFKAKIRSELIDVINDLSCLQQQSQTNDKQILSDSKSYTISVRNSLMTELKGISERVCIVEGQSSHLAAVENTISHKTH